MDSFNAIYQSLDEELPYFSPYPSLEIQCRSGGRLNVAIPIDMITTFNMCDILDAPTHLGDLTFSPPADPARLLKNQEEIGETTIWFLMRPSDLEHLERVSMTLDTPETESVLTLLQRLPRLQSLELQMPTLFDYSSQHESVRRSLMNGIERAIEGFQQLEEIVIPTDLATGTFAELLDRMFDSKTTLPGSRIRYSSRARNLLYVSTT